MSARLPARTWLYFIAQSVNLLVVAESEEILKKAKAPIGRAICR